MTFVLVLSVPAADEPTELLNCSSDLSASSLIRTRRGDDSQFFVQPAPGSANIVGVASGPTETRALLPPASALEMDLCGYQVDGLPALVAVTTIRQRILPSPHSRDKILCTCWPANIMTRLMTRLP